MSVDEEPAAVDRAVLAGQEVYSERVLKIYDPLVLGLTNRFVWRCPRSAMRALYRANTGARHLELGVGTGYFLARTRFPAPSPEVVLLDLNSDALDFASARLARLRPRQVQANVLAPLPVPEHGFDSVAMNMLLHCLPGDGIGDKAVVLANAAKALAPGGRMFGSTVLAVGVPLTSPARAMLRNHNERGILNNAKDSLADLEAAVREHFADPVVRLRGNMALFAGTAR